MNTETPYDRDPSRRIPEPSAPSDAPTNDASPLAVHGDPSQHQMTVQPTRISKNGVAWVRPSDLPTMVGSKIIGRGLDLKAELVRRANRPTRPKAPRERVTRTAIAQPEPPSITHRPGGISL
ncbi:MAG: hypothetical protein ACRDS9_15430 [Pseudonocardiaceae bacterium]